MIEKLVCGHLVSFVPDPSPTDMQLFCRSCMKHVYRHAIPIRILEWGVRCSRCRMSRRCGTDYIKAKFLAGAHVSQYHHDVKILKGSKVHEILKPSPDTLPLSLSDRDLPMTT